MFLNLPQFRVSVLSVEASVFTLIVIFLLPLPRKLESKDYHKGSQFVIRGVEFPKSCRSRPAAWKFLEVHQSMICNGDRSSGENNREGRRKRLHKRDANTRSGGQACVKSQPRGFRWTRGTISIEFTVSRVFIRLPNGYRVSRSGRGRSR